MRHETANKPPTIPDPVSEAEKEELLKLARNQDGQNCPQCGMHFSRKSTMVRHVLVVHLKSSI